MSRDSDKDSEKFERRGDAESDGYRYAMQGIDCLLAANYEPTRLFAEGTTLLLRAISADSQTGNETRAAGHTQILFPLLDRLRADAELPALQALAVEWRGDALFFLGDSRTVDYYESARRQHADIALEARMSWGASPPFENAVVAMYDYCEQAGLAYSPEDLDWEEHVTQKMELFNEHNTE